MSDRLNQFANARMGVNISAQGGIALSGTVVFANANGIAFGMSSAAGSTVTLTAQAGGGLALSAGTTIITSGTAQLASGGGISFGMSASTITAIPIQNSYWNNGSWGDGESIGSQLSMQRVTFPRALNATVAQMIIGLDSGATAGSTMSIGVYTISGFTASLASSASVGLTWNAATSAFSSQTGTMWRSVPVSFAFTPGDYLLAYGVHVPYNSTSYIASNAAYGAVVQSSSSPTFINDAWYGPTTTSLPVAMPSVISGSNLDVTDLNFIPYVEFAGTF